MYHRKGNVGGQHRADIAAQILGRTQQIREHGKAEGEAERKALEQIAPRQKRVDELHDAINAAGKNVGKARRRAVSGIMEVLGWFSNLVTEMETREKTWITGEVLSLLGHQGLGAIDSAVETLGREWNGLDKMPILSLQHLNRLSEKATQAMVPRAPQLRHQDWKEELKSRAASPTKPEEKPVEEADASADADLVQGALEADPAIVVKAEGPAPTGFEFLKEKLRLVAGSKE